MKRRDLERYLREHGARPLREGARHSYWGFDPERSTELPAIARSPGHSRTIFKQLGMPPPSGSR